MRSLSITRVIESHPLAVREVRRHLRGKTFAALLCVVPGLLVLITFGSFLRIDISRQPGMVLFGASVFIWSIIAMIVIPNSAGRAVIQERAEDTWDLVQLTGLSGFALARDYVAAAVLQSVLIACLIAPFLVLATLAGGVGLDLLGTTLGDMLLLGFLGTCLAVASSAAARRRGRRFAGGGSIGAMVFYWIIAGQTWSSWIIFGQLRGGSGPGWIPRALVIIVAIGALLKAGTALSHPASDRVSLPRSFQLFTGFLVLIAGWWGVIPRAASAPYLIFGSVFFAYAATLQPLGITQRQRREITAPGWIALSRRLLIGPGAHRGWRCSLVIMTCLTLLSPWVWGPTITHPIVLTAVIFSIALILLVIADTLGRRLSRQPLPWVQSLTPFALLFLAFLIGMSLTLMAEDYARGSMMRDALEYLGGFGQLGIMDSIGTVIMVLGFAAMVPALIWSFPRREMELRLNPDLVGDRR